MSFDLTCAHCGSRSFLLVIDEEGGSQIICAIAHDQHVADFAEELAEQPEGGAR